MEIRGETYEVTYDSPTTTITCQGSFRLRGAEEYQPIAALLNDVADEKPPTITLDVRRLEFLNSSGINMISKFVIRVRQHKASQLVVQGTSRYPWQSKSLRNLQRLMPDLTLEIETV